eukprot:1147712-Pelagomonas_calceolata.AAC.2
MHAPGHASGALAHQGAQCAEHGPTAVDDLGLAETRQAKHLGVGGQLVLSVDGVGVGAEDGLHITLPVLGLVLVLLVHADLRRRVGQDKSKSHGANPYMDEDLGIRLRLPDDAGWGLTLVCYNQCTLQALAHTPTVNETHLHEVVGLGQAQGVESTVTGQGAVQPARRF